MPTPAHDACNRHERVLTPRVKRFGGWDRCQDPSGSDLVVGIAGPRGEVPRDASFSRLRLRHSRHRHHSRRYRSCRRRDGR